MSDVPEIERTAYHEAGHFVASYVLFPGRLRAFVSIVARDGLAGKCVDEELVAGATVEQCRAEAVTLLAGFAAVVERDPSCAERAALSAHDDFERAEMVVTGARELCMLRTVEFVREHWNKIDLVAQALLDWKSDGDGALEMLCELADIGPDGYDDAVRWLRMAGKLAEDAAPPAWLARSVSPP